MGLCRVLRTKRDDIIVAVLCFIVICQWFAISKGSLVRDFELAQKTWAAAAAPADHDRSPQPQSLPLPAKSTVQPPANKAHASHSALPPQLESLSRVWNYFNETNRCFRSPSKNDEDARATRGEVSGFWYVKIPKTGSSTMAGVAIQIARKVGERKWPMANVTCAHHFRHDHKHASPRKGPGVLWTFLRNPLAQTISEFYHFQVSRRNVTPSDENMLDILEDHKSFQMLYAAGHLSFNEFKKRNSGRDPDPLELMDQEVLSKFDFLGLVERRWESLAVMKLLWGLQTSDMIVLSSKLSGGYDDGMFEGRCSLIQKSPPFNQLSLPVQDYIQNQFPRENHDYGLYIIVNRSLDMTIDAIGRDIVEQEVRLLRATQSYADEQCMHTTIFPCSANGTRQVELSKTNCYADDSGCGYPCTDELFRPGYTVPSKYFPIA